MVVLQDGDFEFAGIRVGIRDSILVSEFASDGVTWREQDAVNPVGDNMFFGRDYRTPPGWSFSLVVNEWSSEGALAVLGSLSAAWNAASRSPGSMQVVRYRVGGRTRRLYGRLRDFKPAVGVELVAGVAPIEATFQQADTWHYDDAARTLQLRIVTASTGGVVLPTTWPLMTESGGERQGVIDDVGGEGPAPYTVTFRGPITDPYVRVSGREIKLLNTLAYDRSVVVDTRLMTATRDDGANLSGALSRKTRLAEARMNPGPAEVVFGGIDPSGTATATVQWRPANYGF